jgi:hypothetical protein
MVMFTFEILNLAVENSRSEPTPLQSVENEVPHDIRVGDFTGVVEAEHAHAADYGV